MTWKNRILELRQVPAEELKANPRNFRKHPEKQTRALRGILKEVGIAGALLAYQHPERGLELIDGHLRQEQGGVWPVLVLDVNEEEAAVILATHDPLTAMAEQDNAVLESILRGLSIQFDGLEDMLAAQPPEFIDIKEAPEEFPTYGEDLDTQYCCPKCGYEWSGKPK